MLRLPLRDRLPGGSRAHNAWFELSRTTCRIFLTLAYRFRVHGRHHLPTSGPALLVANHQSFLDPIICGSAIAPHHLVFIARVGLFKFKPFARLIASYNAIPIRQGEPDTAAIRAALDQLAKGRIVVVYAEGLRTPDGPMHPFQRGAAVLLKRAKCPVIPLAIEGAFDAWPRHKPLPSLWGHRVATMLGPVIPADELLADSPDAALRRLERDIDAMRLELRATLRRATSNRRPAPGPADHPSYPPDPLPTTRSELPVPNDPRP